MYRPYFQDASINSQSDLSNVVDRNEIQNEKTKARTILSSQFVVKDYNIDKICLFFDGCKDRTISLENKRKKS